MLRNRLSAIFVLLLAVFWTACATDPGAPLPAFDAGIDVAEDVPIDAPEDVPEEDIIIGDPYLELMAEPYIRVPYNESAELPVRFVAGNGQPVPDARLRYSYDQVLAGDAYLSSGNATTNEEGIATVDVNGRQLAADFLVEVSVADSDGIMPVSYQIRIAPKDAADYVVRVAYDGPLNLGDVDVFLYTSQSRNCDDFARDYENPSPDVAYLQETVRANADGTFQDRRVVMQADEIPIYYAVAFALKEDIPVAYACTDMLPTDVALGTEVVIEMELEHLWPSIAGTYDIDNNFDLIEGVPDAYEPYVRYIGEFFQSPGGTIVSILEDNWDDFADLPSSIRSVAAGFIDGLLDEFLPESVSNIFEIGSDLYTVFTDFNLNGSLVITEEADRNGNLALNNQIILTQFDFEFRGVHYLRDLRDYGYTAATGEWTGNISFLDTSFGYALNIDSFGLELNYGEVLLFILESVVFPEFIDPSVTSFEDFIVFFIDCEDLADAVDSDGGFFHGIVNSVCDEALVLLADYLRDLITSQSADIGSFFQLQTAEACPMFDLDNPGDFRVDTLGSVTNSCNWAAQIRYDSGEAAGDDMNGTFSAER